MKTRITELLNIDYPIFQGGMAWVADGDLAGAVSKEQEIQASTWNASMKLVLRLFLLYQVLP